MSSEDTRIVEHDGMAGESNAWVLEHKCPPELFAPGTVLVNTYQIERWLGGGGMGDVYLARHLRMQTMHAIKVINRSMASDEQVMQLFYREASVLREIRHDAVVSYDGYVRDGEGREYLVMEYVEGPSLSERLSRGRCTPEEVWALRDRLCAGLAEAHRKGVVHRDLSPDNVILPGNRVEAAKLIDFGLSKLTDPRAKTIVGSSFAGKFRYASPEQFGLYEGAVDARSDIYSLGLTLAASAQGRPLDMGDSFAAAIACRGRLPDLTSVPAQFQEWLTAMLQPNPVNRPTSVQEILDNWPAPTVLAQTGSVPPSRRLHPAASRRTGANLGPSDLKKRQRRVPLLALGALALLAAAGAGLYWLLRPLDVPRPAEDFTLTGPETGEPQRGQPAPRPDESRPDSVAGLSPASTQDRQDERPAGPPASHAADDLDGLLQSGRLDEAFALVQSRIGGGNAPPVAQTWALAELLRTSGKLGQAFALVKALAEEGYGPAAFHVAQAYDPLYWSEDGSGISEPDVDTASRWYASALDSGVGAAHTRLNALQAMREGAGERPRGETAPSVHISDILRSFDCAALRARVSLEGTLVVMGQVRSGEKTALYDRLREVHVGRVDVVAVETQPWPLCAVTSRLFRRTDPAAQQFAPRIVLARDPPNYRVGDRIDIRIQSGSDRDGRISLAYLDASGEAFHILPYEGEPDAITARGELKIAPLVAEKPIGPSLLVATWCKDSLYSKPPPEKQPLDGYLDTVTAALNAAGADCAVRYRRIEVRAR